MDREQFEILARKIDCSFYVSTALMCFLTIVIVTVCAR